MGRQSLGPAGGLACEADFTHSTAGDPILDEMPKNCLPQILNKYSMGIITKASEFVGGGSSPKAKKNFEMIVGNFVDVRIIDWQYTNKTEQETTIYYDLLQYNECNRYKHSVFVQ